MKRSLLDIINNIRWFSIYLFTFQKFNTKKIFFFLYLFNFINLFLIFFINFIYKNLFVRTIYSINALFYLKKVPLLNKTCFLIANGPSLKKKDLLKINKTTDIFVCNNFVLVNKVTSIKIKYNVLTDIDYINDLKKRKKKSWLCQMSHIEKQPEFYVFPYHFKKNLENNNIFKNSNIKYFQELPYPTVEYMPNYFDIKTGIPWSYNVSISMINLAIAMGYNKINLLGFDGTFHLNEDFYEEKKYNKVSNRKKNNFKYRLIRSSSNLIGIWSTYRFLKSHENIKFYCKKNNIIIKNFSSAGILDVYEK